MTKSTPIHATRTMSMPTTAFVSTFFACEWFSGFVGVSNHRIPANVMTITQMSTPSEMLAFITFCMSCSTPANPSGAPTGQSLSSSCASGTMCQPGVKSGIFTVCADTTNGAARSSIRSTGAHSRLMCEL